MTTLSVKPGPRYTLPDWHINTPLIVSNAERQRSASHQVRQESRALRNETTNQTKWDEHDTRTRLADRIDVIDRWRETLARCLEDMDMEINILAQLKEDAERALQAKNLPLDVAIECLAHRDRRQLIDLVKDVVEDELQKEVEVIEAARKAIQQKISEAFEQLCLLQEARQQLNLDHRGKLETLEIERTCLSLHWNSPNISLKLDPTRVPNRSTTLDQWEQFSNYHKDRGDAEMKASTLLREAIAITIAQTSNELDAQREATEFAFRKRIHEMEMAHNELRWQEKNVLDEIAEIEEDIRRIEEDLRIKTATLKLAHTRLETRTYRPNIDLCRDKAQYGLTDEVHQLEGTIASLKQKMAQTQDALDALYKHLARIQEDIRTKENSLLQDNKCMDTRKKLTVPSENYMPTVDTFSRTTNRNLVPQTVRQAELAAC